MNDRLSTSPSDLGAAPPPADPALVHGARLGAFEIQRVLARSASTTVYLATDHALSRQVAIQEYLPARLVRRDADQRLRAIDAWHDDVIARGLRAFVDEARLLAHCDHPALVRVNQLFEAHGTAYRVMPLYAGQRLSDLRREMVGAPDETALRDLLDGLLGALEAIHRGGHVHGGVSPANILLLADDRPLLLGPGAAGREIGSDLVDSLMATLETASASASGPAGADAGTPPAGPARDLYALAETLRFCITGEMPAPPGRMRPRDPLIDAIAREFTPDARPQYGAALIGALDAALSPFAEDRPLSAAQFRDWLARGVPGGPVRFPPAPPAPPRIDLPPAPPRIDLPPMPPRADVPPTPVRIDLPPRSTPMPKPPTAAAPPASAAAKTGPAPGLPSTPPIDATPPTPPMPRWPEAGPDLIEPIVPERPPWVASPPPRSTPPAPPRPTLAARARRKVYMASGLAALAAVVLAAATGLWNWAPDIQLEPGAERTAARAPAPPPAQADTSTTSATPTADASPSASVPTPTPAPASTPPPPQAQAPEPAAAAEPAAPPPTNVTATPPLPATEAASAAAPEPARVAAAEPPKTDRRPVASRPTRTAAATPPVAGNPRAACEGRTEFALYRCMVQQCQAKRWSLHPQCVLLRQTDRVQ